MGIFNKREFNLKMKKFVLKIDWKYIIIEILIVITGITIAFQLNNWNEARKRESKETYFIKSFYDENKANLERIERLISYNESFLKDVDTLIQIIEKDNYSDKRIKELTLTLFSLPYFSPEMVTFENIQSSYEMEIIKDIKLRKQILITYKAFSECMLANGSATDYSTSMVHPFVLNNVDFRPSEPFILNNKEKISFRNIVPAYYYVWTEQLKVYKEVLNKTKLLDEYLTTAQHKND